MIASAAAMAAAAGLGCFLQIGLASGRVGGLLLPTIVGLRPQRRGQGRRQFAREGKGEQSDAAISAGLIHENQPTVCKGTAFSWNKYQK